MLDSTIILKGFHFSLPTIPNFYYVRNSFKYERLFKFSEQHIYEFSDIDRFDVNKLFGFSIGMHHNNSFRYGWNCIDGKIQIYSYCYVKKERTSEFLFSPKLNEWYTYTINVIDGDILFEVKDSNDDYVVFDRKHLSDIPFEGFGYGLRPYFGGQHVAPKTMWFNIKKDYFKIWK